jgi:NAD(P)-dependent dehydrogenase (short-subunit alcohol dehydrogenase family)
MLQEDWQGVAVTGASGSLGIAVCRAFLDAGAAVVAIERRTSGRLSEALGPDVNRIRIVSADLASPGEARKALDRAAESLGGLSVLCSLAGGFEMGPFEDFTPEQMDRMLTLNFRTAYHAALACLPHLRRGGRGKIVFVGSRPALSSGPGMAAYAASKAAVLSLCRSLAAELLPHDIQVNAVIPSIFDTPANRAALPAADYSRWPRPEQIAAVIRWLCSTEADIVSGAEVPVYGLA